jgi:hypothetical protein
VGGVSSLWCLFDDYWPDLCQGHHVAGFVAGGVFVKYGEDLPQLAGGQCDLPVLCGGGHCCVSHCVGVFPLCVSA